MDFSFSNRLLLVPLFHGFSRLDFIDLVEKTPFDFQTYKHGKPIIEQGTLAKSLAILLQGSVTCETESPDHSYTLSEPLNAPCVLQPECLFGLHNTYIRSVKAKEKAQIVWLAKQDVRCLILSQPAFQINFYNMLCSIAQSSHRQLWQAQQKSLEERFKLFVSQRSIRPVGERTLRIMMTDLAREIGTSRLSVSKMLANFEEQGKLTYARTIIHIHALENL